MRPTALLPLLILVLPLRAQDFDSACTQQKHVIGLLKNLHFDPPAQNRSTCLEVIDLFVRTADDKNIFFMQGDVGQLKKLAGNVPGSDSYCMAIGYAYRLFSQRLAQLDSITSSIEARPLILDGRDTINFVFQ